MGCVSSVALILSRVPLEPAPLSLVDTYEAFVGPTLSEFSHLMHRLPMMLPSTYRNLGVTLIGSFGSLYAYLWNSCR